MIENYAVFYKFVKRHDALIVTFNYGNKATSYKKDGNIGIVYSDDKPIAYNFFGIKKFMKIHVKNMIYVPSDALIDVLNLLLGNKYEHLAYKTNSGYKIALVSKVKRLSDKDFDLYYITDGKESFVVEDTKNALKPNDLVVVANKGIMLKTGKVFIEPHICTTSELGLDEENKIYIIEDDAPLGVDFFEMEENQYVGN